MIDFTIKILDLQGKEVQGENETALTLKEVCVNALQLIFTDEKAISGLEKLKRGILAEKIFLSEKPLELNAVEITTIKDLVAKAYGPLVVLRAWKVLDPASVKD